MSCGLLLKRKDMLAGGEFQFPRLDFFLLGECIRLHYPLYYYGKFSSRFIDILDIALVALDRRLVIISIRIRFSSDCEL
jgi:hypothetical protein